MSDGQNQENIHIFLNLNIQEVRVLNTAVNHYLENWPGSPKRPAEEQELLFSLKSYLFATILEYRRQAGELL